MIAPEKSDATINQLLREMFAAYAPRPTLDVHEWANAHRELSKVNNRTGGRWRSRCYQVEIMREMTNPDVRSIVVVGASQEIGKSEMILNFVGRQIHLNPGPIMLVQPTNELGERFSKKRVAPMIRDNPVLLALVGDQKSRASGNTMRAKDFPGGTFNIAGANTPNELCSDPQRDVLIDEVDRCEEAAGKEGDIVGLSEARQLTFGEDAFSLYTSSPSGIQPRPQGEEQPKGVSKILMLFAESDQRFWLCPCQKCGHRQTLRWSQVQWPPDRPEEARYVCEKSDCGHPHGDAGRVAMIENGAWTATAPFTGRRGYFLNGIYSLSAPQRGCRGKLHQMARDFLRAKRRGMESLRAWTNTFLCECFDEGAESVKPQPLFDRRFCFGPILPEPVCLITAGVDIHPDRIEAQIIGWGEGEQGWPLEYAIFEGRTNQLAPGGPWDALDAWLKQTFEHPSGAEVPVLRTCVDTGHSTDAAYDFCRARTLRGIYAVKGHKAQGAPLVKLPHKSGVKRVRLWLVSKHGAMTSLYARLKLTDQGHPGYLHFRNDREPMFGREYFQQLTAADVITVHRAGVALTTFDPGKRRDEAGDTFCYSLAALKMRGEVPWVKLLQRVKEQGEAVKENARKTTPENPASALATPEILTQPRPTSSPPRRGFVTAGAGWWR